MKDAASPKRPPRRLDILYLGTLPPHPGGSAVSGASLLEEFARCGHQVRAVAPAVGDARDDADRFDRAHPELGVTRFPAPWFHTDPVTPAPRAFREEQHRQVGRMLPDLIAGRRPDVILVGREAFAVDVRGVAPVRGLPVVLRLAGSAMLGLLGGTYPPDTARSLVDGLEGAARLVSPSRHLARRVRTLGLSRVLVIPTGIDTARFAPRPKDPAWRRRLALEDGDIVVAHVSNLKAIKRPLDLVESARIATARNPRLVYVIVGDGPMRAKLAEACRHAGLEARFRFTGWVDYAVMPALLGLADLVVLSSADENLARVYLETQASGRVLIASDIPAAREVVEDGETGLLFPAGDASALAARILAAAADPDLRARIGRLARARAERFTALASARRYLRLFARLRSRRPTPAVAPPER